MKRIINRLIAAATCLLPAAVMAATVTLNPVADAYVQGGGGADINHGSEPELRARTSNFSNYDSYLRFDTGTVGGEVISARLLLHPARSVLHTDATSAYGVSDITWSETAITWNTKPALGSSLGRFAGAYTVDVTAYVQSERAAGRNVISLGLHNDFSTVDLSASSREGGKPPQLVLVTNDAPSVSLTAPAGGSVYTAPASITLSATAADADGSIASVEFYNGATLIGPGTLNGGSYTLDWANVAAGSYSLTAKATDNQGAVTVSAPVSITVNPPNVPPSVSLTAPADGSSYTAPASITLTADATDTDGSIASVEFYDGATLIASLTTPPYTYTWNDVPAGSYSLTAKATDDQGASTSSTPAAVSVSEPVANNVYYIHADHLNTPRVITDASNKVVWRWDSDPFGASTANEDPDGDGTKFSYNLRFPGQYYDRETNLHYNYFRDYDPTTGRYVQSDPIGLEGGINIYSYVSGNPVSYVDPSGLLKWTGSFDLKSGGIGKLGVTRGTFQLTSECDIDGHQGFATIVGYSGSLGVGIPASQTRGTIMFEDGHIRANPRGFNGRFTVDSIGIQLGTFDLGKTTVYLGESISMNVAGAGVDAGIQFGIYGRAEVVSSGIRSCGCKTK